jgi:hypothetical protein
MKASSGIFSMKGPQDNRDGWLSAAPSSRFNPDRALLFGLLALEALVFTAWLAYHRLGDRPLAASWSSRPGLAMMVTFLPAVFLAVWLIRRILSIKASAALPTIFLNLVSLLVIFVSLESVVRLCMKTTNSVAQFRGDILPPFDWRRYSKVFDHFDDHSTLLIYHPTMGWVPGPDRKDPDGMYFSSLEGIRAPRAGISFPKNQPAPPIVLVGDSFTYCADVKYEDSWGCQLGEILGSNTPVLNFGVPGYGVDQAFLRYREDARRWHPRIVILGIFDDDVIRSVSVYPFLRVINGMPLSKPRFVVQESRLETVNSPAIPPSLMARLPGMDDLPHLNLDRAYDRAEWLPRFYHHSYFARYLARRCSPARSDPYARYAQCRLEVKSLNTFILQSFMDESRKDGALPLLLYFPGYEDLINRRSGFAKELLDEGRFPYLDLTACFSKIPPSQYFSDIHYSPVANRHIAREVANAIRRLEAAPRERAGAPPMEPRKKDQSRGS